MKKTERDYEYLETSPEILARGLRRITRPKRLDAMLKKERATKSRLTIYLDADIVMHFKEIAEGNGAGYQTLINSALRQILDDGKLESDKKTIKDDLLMDKKFLRKLKTALAA